MDTSVEKLPHQGPPVGILRLYQLSICKLIHFQHILTENKKYKHSQILLITRFDVSVILPVICYLLSRLSCGTLEDYAGVSL